ncbi:hypothetical protein [Polaromonas sp. JS666]|uniref:hypothetical protein n=1 Tax=Polaromonas sp. (strain JS666 / ATCC BAA-500) TaxID=296591 RepID=UPI0000532C98|nr:hypothetical protein [Polaromonas sp. JS666]ABE47253.1 hypothetical protein Bpro_5399 [Polaromonas sp. JS666]
MNLFKKDDDSDEILYVDIEGLLQLFATEFPNASRAQLAALAARFLEDTRDEKIGPGSDSPEEIARAREEREVLVRDLKAIAGDLKLSRRTRRFLN